MKTTMKFLLFGMMAIAISISSCSKDGATGAAGPAGIAGINGQDGADGTDGTNGSDGADGNANVQTFTFDTSSLSGEFFNLAFTELTQEVLDNDALLFYIKGTDLANVYYPIPGISHNDILEVELNPSRLTIYFYNRTDGAGKSVPAGKYTQVRAVILKSGSSKSTTLNQLKSKGIDTNDYYALMDYFGLEY